MILGMIIPTDELTPSFFGRIGGSTTKQISYFASETMVDITRWLDPLAHETPIFP